MCVVHYLIVYNLQGKNIKMPLLQASHAIIIKTCFRQSIYFANSEILFIVLFILIRASPNATESPRYKPIMRLTTVLVVQIRTVVSAILVGCTIDVVRRIRRR